MYITVIFSQATAGQDHMVGRWNNPVVNLPFQNRSKVFPITLCNEQKSYLILRGLDLG